MISIASPGKIAKCGWFSNSLAASSCEAARTTVNPVRALLTSVMPFASILRVLPSGPPISTMTSLCFSTQRCQAAMPSRSIAFRSASGLACQAFIFSPLMLPR